VNRIKVAAEVADSPISVITSQAANGVAPAMAVVFPLVGVPSLLGSGAWIGA
jgi:aspartate carbamoyltransferase catalytic subunit